MRVLLLFTLVALGGVALADKTLVKGRARPRTAEVVAPIGKIRGSFNESRLGRRFFSARGIRYAEPPVGHLRFRQAVPAKSWTTVFDATQEGSACPTPYSELTSEDCLRLNVYSPELPSSKKRAVRKPVIVFFHPGGFYVFSGQSYIFGPEYLMDQDVVLVTVNYRLGTLGFISTGDSEAPGNLGLKDQVLALRWVRANIAAFGGDPENVTISGYSAGGWSVSLHMVSPMSRGLFHRAIAMSGAATAQEPLGGNQIDLAKKQARLLDCPTDTSQKMIACLKTKPMEAFQSTQRQMFEYAGYYPVLLWTPVVEPEIPGVERFLTAEPEALIRQGRFHQVPLITGICKDEFGGSVIPWVEESRKGNNTMFDNLNNNWEELAPLLFQYERGTPRSKEISRALRAFYFKDQPVSVATADGVAQLFAEGLIGFQVHRLSKLIAQRSSKPVYYYKFTYQGRYSFGVWSDTKKPYGVVHHDDLMYLFYMKPFFPLFNVTDPEYVAVKRWTSIWGSFAATGNPIPKDDKNFENVNWEAFTPTNNRFLEFGDTVTMQTGLYAERMNEWEKLFPLYPAATENNVKH